jgi:hypothetical protein
MLPLFVIGSIILLYIPSWVIIADRKLSTMMNIAAVTQLLIAVYLSLSFIFPQIMLPIVELITEVRTTIMDCTITLVLICIFFLQLKMFILFLIGLGLCLALFYPQAVLSKTKIGMTIIDCIVILFLIFISFLNLEISIVIISNIIDAYIFCTIIFIASIVMMNIVYNIAIAGIFNGKDDIMNYS